MSTCKICGDLTYKSATIPGYIEPEYFNILHCEACGTSTAEVPNDYDFNNLYTSIYGSQKNIGGYNRYEEYALKVVSINNPLEYLSKLEPQYLALKNFVTVNINKDATILEVGSGLGYTTFALLQNGYKFSKGTDLSREAIKRSKELFGDHYYYIDEIDGKKFDFIFATEVIEHVSDPVFFVNGLLNKLTPNGVLFLTTPRSITPIKVNQNKNNVWISDPPPVHLWCFTANSLELIGKNAGATTFDEISVPLANSLIKIKAVSYEPRHVITSDAKRSDDIFNQKKLFVKKIVKKIITKLHCAEDVRILYSLLLKLIGRGNRYTYLSKGLTEIIAVTYRKNQS
jgi:SAM-dependent methyltransferase